MTAPVLSPVRWWRDDATRYVTRGPQIVPGATLELGTQWAFDLIAGPVDPGLRRLLNTYAELVGPERLAAACAIPADLLQGDPSGMSGTGVAINEYRRRCGLPPL